MNKDETFTWNSLARPFPPEAKCDCGWEGWRDEMPEDEHLYNKGGMFIRACPECKRSHSIEYKKPNAQEMTGIIISKIDKINQSVEETNKTLKETSEILDKKWKPKWKFWKIF